MGAIKLSKAIEGFLISRSAEGYSKETLKIYEWALIQMSNYLQDPDLKTITPEQIQAFYSFLQTDYIPKRTSGEPGPLKPRSIENAWTAIRSFYNWATAEMGVKKRPDGGIKRPRYKATAISPFTPEEVRKILKACERTKEAATKDRKAFTMRRGTAKRDIAIVLVLLDTGLRVSECARLKIKDVNFENNEIFVDAFGSGQKTKSRHVYIGKATRNALWRYLAEKEDPDPTDPIFISRDNRPMDRNSIRLMLNEAGQRAGVKNVHPHRFRHTFAVEYLRNGGDVFTLQRLLGHSTLDMVNHYLALADTDSKAAHRRASPADHVFL